MGKRKGKTVRKNKQTTEVQEANDEVSRAPHSFVVHRGKTGKFVQELCKDFRKVMEPYTASNVKARPKNVVKDFVHIAGMLKVSHLCMFTKTTLGPYLKLARFPRGPTLTFKIKEYTLGRDVRSSLKRQITYEKQYLHHPLLVLNNFPTEEREFQLCTSMFQNMFPTINVTKVKLNNLRRCVLINYNRETGLIDFRHYTIKVVPTGVNRGVKKIVTSKVPNLGRLENLADMVTGGGCVSESEAEEDEASKVVLPQEISLRGALPSQQSSVRLVELGPRISMELMKIEDGLLDGEVMFHKFIEKTEEEVKEIKRRREKRRKEKEQRRKEQEANVKKKDEAKRKNKEKSLQGMGMNKPEFTGKEKKAIREFEGENADKSDDDDEEWYRKEVGAEPEKDLFKQKRTEGSGSGSGSGQPRLGKRFSKVGKPRESRPSGAGKGKFARGKSAESSFRDKKDGFRDKKKRKTKVFNSQGVGPNFKRSSKPGSKPAGKAGPLRGVKTSKMKKTRTR